LIFQHDIQYSEKSEIEKVSSFLFPTEKLSQKVHHKSRKIHGLLKWKISFFAAF
jgi:hypothetical protein